MHKIVISDTSKLILLQKIDELNLLRKVYWELITPPEIAEKFAEKTAKWIKVQESLIKSIKTFLQHRLIMMKQVRLR